MAQQMTLDPHRLRGQSDLSEQSDIRSQFGALCWRRRKGGIEVLLVTTRSSGRWVPPKGWPLPGRSPVEAAAREALEEAGVEGEARDVCLGLYPYIKDIDQPESQPCVIALFPLKVRKVHEDWPERGQRKRKWFTREKAAAQVQEPELQALIREFDPDALPG